jgi:hypothetical protein
MTLSQVAEGGEGLQKQRVVVNVLNKSKAADGGCPPASELKCANDQTLRLILNWTLNKQDVKV